MNASNNEIVTVEIKGVSYKVKAGIVSYAKMSHPRRFETIIKQSAIKS